MSATVGSLTVTVEAAFGDPPLTATASNTWTDITEHVRSLSTRRGRSHSLDAVTPGRLTLVLDNKGRRFDPLHTTGPYYGDLVAGVKIRVTFTYAAVAYRVIVAYTDDWQQDYESGNTDATCTVPCTDGFKWLAQHKLDESLFTSRVASLRPVHWWRLNEAASATTVTDSGSAGLPGTVVGAPTDGEGLGATGLDAGSGATAYDGSVLTQIPGQRYPQMIQCDGPLSTWEWGVCLIDPLDADAAQDGYLLYDNGQWRIYLNDSGASEFADIAEGFKRNVTYPTLAGGERKVLVWKRQTGAAPTVWVDGVSAGSALGDSSFAVLATTIGGAKFNAVGNDGGSIRIQHLALFNNAPADATVQAYAQELTAYANASTLVQCGIRVGDLLDIVDWATADRDIDTGARPIIAATTSNSTALGYLTNTATGEQALMFCAADGDFTFVDRTQLRTATRHTTSQTTFSDDGSNIPYLAGTLSFSVADDLLVSEVTVTGDGIPAQTARSADTSLPTRSESLATFVTIPASARALAEHRVALRDTVTARPSTFTVNPERSPAAIYPQVLDLEVGDRITVERTPQGVGTQIVAACAVDSIAWRISDSHEITVQITASPTETTGAALWDTAVWDTGTWGF